MFNTTVASAGDPRDTGSIPGLGRYPRVGNGNPLQYSCLDNSTDGGTWQATVHGVAKSRDTTEQRYFTYYERGTRYGAVVFLQNDVVRLDQYFSRVVRQPTASEASGRGKGVS